MNTGKADSFAKSASRSRRVRCRSRAFPPRKPRRAFFFDSPFPPLPSRRPQSLPTIAPEPRRRPQRGFSLIELAIVLAAAALLIGGLMVPLSAQIERYRMRQTEVALAEATEALLGYAVVHTRLPCPDTDGDGAEDRSASTSKSHPCRRAEGALPSVTLGVRGLDGWNRRIRYRGNDAYTKEISNHRTTGDLEITDRVNNTNLVNREDNGPAAILFSCGSNGVPDGENDGRNRQLADNPPNCSNPSSPANALYEHGPQARSGSGGFDDVLVWLSKYVLLDRLVRAGVWP